MLYIFYMTAKQEKKHVICYSIHYFMYFSRSICVHLFFFYLAIIWAGPLWPCRGTHVVCSHATLNSTCQMYRLLKITVPSSIYMLMNGDIRE